jgi:sugar lactone lactonase YvrE
MERRMTIHDETSCLLGEGPLWHPEREELFWFDILGRTLHAQGRRQRLPDLASAAGWVDHDTLLVAMGNALHRHVVGTDAFEPVAVVDANPLTRFNDGRADPQGGFWISRMGLRTEGEAGGIWRFHRGEVRPLFDRITIPNAICFDPEGAFACFADTARQTVWSVALDEAGWPRGEPAVFLDLRDENLDPDGRRDGPRRHALGRALGQGRGRGLQGRAARGRPRRPGGPDHMPGAGRA